MSFQLTVSGLDTQTQAELVAELTAKLRATFGNNLNTSTESIMGQLVNIISEINGLNQQVLLAVYRAFDPNNALGVALDRLAALTGSIRNGETFSTVSGILTFSGVGTMVNGDLINNDDNSTEWQLIDGPHGPGPGVFPATFAAIVAGPTLANANTNWSAITVVPGLDGFTNPTDDANPGRVAQTDPDFRITRQNELFAQNIGGTLAIKGVVSKVDGVVTVNVYHNPATAPTDADGIPFKAFNVVVETTPTVPPAALQQLIFDAIFSATGAGGEAFGTDFSGTATDAEGQPQPVAFDVITLKDIFVNVTLSTAGTEDVISDNIKAVSEAALLETAQTDFSEIGQNAIAFRFSGVISDLIASGEISGVTTVLVELSETALVGPFIDPVPVGIRERPDYDSVNILVTVTA
jgi:hypothetical protein